MTENYIEQKLRKVVEAAGGKCYKFTSPGNTGVPDRVIVLPGGRVIFAELKAEGGRLSSLQRRQLGRLKALGAEVRVIRGEAGLKDFVGEVLGNEI